MSMFATRSLSEDGILTHHIHLLRLIMRTLADDKGDVGAVEESIGELHNVLGLTLIKKATGEAPAKLQAASKEQLREALAVVADLVDEAGYHPHPWYPAGWRESMAWVQQNVRRKP